MIESNVIKYVDIGDSIQMMNVPTLFHDEALSLALLEPKV